MDYLHKYTKWIDDYFLETIIIAIISLLIILTSLHYGDYKCVNKHIAKGGIIFDTTLYLDNCLKISDSKGVFYTSIKYRCDRQTIYVYKK